MVRIIGSSGTLDCGERRKSEFLWITSYVFYGELIALVQYCTGGYWYSKWVFRIRYEKQLPENNPLFGISRVDRVHKHDGL